MNTPNEFKPGQHKIGYVSQQFTEAFKDVAFESHALPTFQKLGRDMADAEIESTLKPGLCELGDILAFLDGAPEECKDGWSNLFYMEAFVVRVRWRAGDRGWGVGTWERGGGGWYAGSRVFSPATGSRVLNTDPLSLESLSARILELEKWRDRVERTHVGGNKDV